MGKNLCMFWNRVFCVFSPFFGVLINRTSCYLQCDDRRIYGRKNSRIFAQSFMEIVIIGWNAGKVTLNTCLKFVFFRQFIIGPTFMKSIRRFYDLVQGKCTIYVRYCIFLPVLMVNICEVIAHVFVFFFFCCFERVSFVKQQVIWLEFITSFTSM